MKKLIIGLLLSLIVSSQALEQLENMQKRVYFPLDTTSGTHSELSVVRKFGVNLNIPAATENHDIWEGGGEYQFDTFGTAPILYLSSSNAGDTQPIKVQGLDIEGTLTTQIITLTGQTSVLLTTPLWRVFRMENEADEGGDIIGTVYCHTDASPTAGVPTLLNTRAIINDGNNQTLMAIFTIPKGEVGFMFKGEVGVELEGNAGALAEYAHIHFETRKVGKVFKTKKAFTCMVGGGSAIYQDTISFPDPIPALTDLRVRSKEATQIMGLFSTFDILLVKESSLSPSFLESIGQP